MSGLDSKPDRYVTALLLHSIGKDALRVYNGELFNVNGITKVNTKIHLILSSVIFCRLIDKGTIKKYKANCYHSAIQLILRVKNSTLISIVRFV